MADDLTFQAKGISVTIDLAVGHIADLRIESRGRMLRPLHRAPWIDEPDLPGELADGLKRLSGDFLCAPFSASDVEKAPAHGWPANSPWQTLASERIDGGWQARFRLQRLVLGASVEKTLTLRDSHPFLYQEHVLAGGKGEISVAHHPMTSMRNGGRLAFSPKRLAMTPGAPLEPDPARGRHMLAYPARSLDLHAFPTAAGGLADLSDYPVGARNEDFVILVEADHDGPGWTAVSRAAEADLVLVLKNPADLPVTMLWISNGGRDYTPWNGRHVGVLGIEDGRTAAGHAASIGDNPLRQENVPTSFSLQEHGRIAFRQVVGALAGPLEPPQAVEPGEGILRTVSAAGEIRDVPFDNGFLRDPAGS
ncbi:MAG: hypothetical protein K0S21_2384 [Rhizobiaceae bacterium]|nr:hypothetical protein [Rhizobiaceae bacterium]